jgi:hypothetical protein
MTLSLSGHYDKTMAFNSFLKRERNKEWQEDELGKSASQTNAPHTLYKATHK